MSKNKLNRFSLKRSNVKTFLFFLIFTSLLWLFIQFSKNYTQEIEVAIEYINIPEDRMLHEDSDQSLKLILNGNGFRLINNIWNTPKLEFDITNAKKNVDGDYYFYIDKSHSFLNDKLNFKGRILSIQKDTLKVKLDVNLQKKIPVKLTKNIIYAPGYGSGKGVLLNTDSVMISGPERVISDIKFISTENLELDNLKKDYKQVLALERTDLPSSLTIIPEEVEANITVSKFTEGSQDIPIKLKNIPKGKEIKIFPKEVKVVYRVGLDIYNEINIRDFKVVADYNKVAEESSFLILELVDMPKSIHDVRLQDKQVQFVILH